MTSKTSSQLDYSPLADIPEDSNEHATRPCCKAALIAQGEVDFAAGNYYDDDEVDAFLDQLEIDPYTRIHAPRPKPPRK